MVTPTGPEVPFSFVDDDAPISGEGFLAVVDGSTLDADELLKTLGNALQFPGHYGVNWNALLDCLCDFTWEPEHWVTIWHEALPYGMDEQMPEYLGVLATAVCRWRRNPRHDLRVVFRARDRQRVLDDLAKDRYWQLDC